MDERSAVAETSTSQHSQEKDIHAPSGTRTRNPRQGAAADLRLRARGHCDRHIYLHPHIINLIKKYLTGPIITGFSESFEFSPATFNRISLEHTYPAFYRLSRKCVVSFSQSRIYVHVLNCLALIPDVLQDA